MKLIPQTVELLKQEDWKKQIELAARTCYKSEDKIAEGTAEVMLDRLINSKHYAMLEHGTIYLHCHSISMITLKMYNKYYFNPYSRAKISTDKNDVYITTNYRVIKEHGWKDDLKYLCEPTDNHVKRYTFRLTTSIGIVRELLRHRVFSFANESTRYCNYSKNKFGNEITFINNATNQVFSHTYALFDLYQKIEETYLNLIKKGVSPQLARDVLPLSTKSELIMTGFEDDWDRFLELRLDGVTGKPHPDMLQLASMIKSSLH